MQHLTRQVTAQHLAARLFAWRDGPGPLYLRLAEALRTLAEAGAIATGTRLPSERTLALALRVSRNTVTAAYRQLRDTGWLVGNQGAAPRVGAVTRVPECATAAADPLAALFVDRDRPRFDLTAASPTPAPAVIDALGRLPELMPYSAYRETGLHPGGHPLLLEAIAEHLRRDGIAAHPDEIVVTNGAQQALTLVAEAMHRPRRPTAIEAVTFPGVIDALRRRGRAQLITLPVDQDGLRVEAAARLIRATSPIAAYITTFQNPTGRAIGDVGGERLLEAALDAKTAIVEDRVLADLHLREDAAPTPFAALRPDAAVTTVGSVSKVLWGGLRIGWIHTNRTLAAHLRARRRALDLGGAAPMQLAAAWLLAHHYRDAGAWRVRRLRESLAALTAAITAADLGWEFQRPAGGPNLWVRLPQPTARDFAELASREGVAVAAGDAFALTPGTAVDMIRIPFFLPPADLEAAVAALSDIWERHRRQGRHHRQSGPQQY
ncbi:PLP-dependent aminotransferase family protein [Glycomyces sp. TRM65418]|uniref:aminotransferase-like domain-containing protein n=1 Tax=Glycomyces sp. TRM65418 TaxID=2867006 RepID=UPI001CE64104|nr:PLP-dependent aminotransferase family protein [Glycomyces sp. TRM65418]MCC3765162.1 PLP-dependent aminotransferase family protein [Glycomyces sp. TRM65418]QZD54788.1 PLP-dependent aminotransferase family protein [Glycomyces sp. TRM65418]